MLKEAAARLRAAGIEAPLAEARILLAHVLKVPLTRLDLLVASHVESGVAERYSELVAERATRRPLAYVTGDTEFMGLRFRCDERALVPRPETEVLVEAVLDLVAGHEVVLDIGTGTGAIGLSVAALPSPVKALLTDLPPDAPPPTPTHTHPRGDSRPRNAVK